MLESLFNKVIGNQAFNFIKIRLQIWSFETSEILKNTYFKEHLPADATINERQQETHTLLGKKSESHLGNLSRGQWVLPENYGYLNSAQLRNYNYGHSIMIIFDVLPNFLFATGETKADY